MCDKHMSVVFIVPEDMTQDELHGILKEALFDYALDDYQECQKAESKFLKEGDEDPYQKKIDNLEAISLAEDVVPPKVQPWRCCMCQKEYTCKPAHVMQASVFDSDPPTDLPLCANCYDGKKENKSE